MTLRPAAIAFVAALGALAVPAAAGAAESDFNGDGFEDLAIGTPGEQLGTDDSAGVVHIVYGSASGLQPDDDSEDQLSEDLLPGQASEPDERFGAALATGDFDGDGFDDLAVGAPGEFLAGAGEPFFAGAVFVYMGASEGIDREESTRFDQDTPGLGGVAEPDPSKFGDGERFGGALAAGRIDPGAREDLVVGVPEDTLDGVEDAGALHVLYGGGAGPRAAGSDYVHQAKRGVAGRLQENGQFAVAVTAGDFGGTGVEEVAAHATKGEDPGEGVVHVFDGGAGGVSARDRLVMRSSRGMAGPPGDEFGTVLLADRLGRDEHDDLIVGAPEDRVGLVNEAGAVNVIYGSDSGLTTSGDQFFTQATEGVQGTTGLEDRFGSAFAVGKFDGGPAPDLAIGADLDNETVENHGAAMVFYGAGSRLDVGDNEFFNQDDPLDGDLLGTAEPNDFFGFALAAGRYGEGSRDSLATGVPGDTVGTADNAGAVSLLPGGAGGLTVTGQSLFSQAELFGSPESERFASALAGPSSSSR